jgi:uncharacterized membrane protein
MQLLVFLLAVFMTIGLGQQRVAALTRGQPKAGIRLAALLPICLAMFVMIVRWEMSG